MVDSNDASIITWCVLTAVQIPLWSIVTQDGVDEEGNPKVQIPLWSIVTAISPTNSAKDSGFKFLYGR